MERQLAFEGHSLATLNNYDTNAYQATLKQANVPNTAAQEGPSIDEERFYQKEDINSEDSCEISFQKSFMAEHNAVLTQHLKRYIETAQTYILLNDRQNTIMPTEQPDKPNEQTSCQEFVQVFSAHMAAESRGKLLSEVEANDRLFEMLNIVARECPPKMATHLVSIALQILDEYRKRVANSDQSLDLFALMDIAYHKSNTMQNSLELGISCIPLPLLQHQEHKFMLAHQKFMEIYCVTTILVLAEYFENPYYERQQQAQLPKRLLQQLDDDAQMEEQVHTRPQKKRKSSR